jgi:hypothetical protein
MMNDVGEIIFDDHESQFSNRDAEILRKSIRPPKPSTKTLEAIVNKYRDETSCERRRDAEALRKSRRAPKPSTKALEVLLISTKRRQVARGGKM